MPGSIHDCPILTLVGEVILCEELMEAMTSQILEGRSMVEIGGQESKI
jgi:hypothetical protein